MTMTNVRLPVMFLTLGLWGWVLARIFGLQGLFCRCLDFAMVLGLAGEPKFYISPQRLKCYEFSA